MGNVTNFKLPSYFYYNVTKLKWKPVTISRHWNVRLIAKNLRKSAAFRGRFVVAYHTYYTSVINANSYSSEAIRVELTGYDLRGATLRATFEGHAVSALKMWLLFCRGIKPVGGR